MNQRSLMIVNAALGTVHGLAFLLLPTFALGFYGVTAGAGEQLMGRFFGTELLTVALVCWLGRNLRDPEAMRVIAIGMCIPNAVGTVVATMATLAGVMNQFGWHGVAIFLLLAICYATVLLADSSRVQPAR